MQGEHSPRIRSPIGLHPARSIGRVRARRWRLEPSFQPPVPKPPTEGSRLARPAETSGAGRLPASAASQGDASLRHPSAPTDPVGCPYVAPQGAAAAARSEPSGDPPSDPEASVSTPPRGDADGCPAAGEPLEVAPSRPDLAVGPRPHPQRGGSSEPARLSASARGSLRLSPRVPGASRLRAGEAGPSTGGTSGGSFDVPWDRSADRPGTSPPPGTVPCRKNCDPGHARRQGFIG